MTSLLEEIKEIERFQLYSEDEKKLRVFLGLYYNNHESINNIILKLRFSKKNLHKLHIISENESMINENLFTLYKKIYKKDYLKIQNVLKIYKNNSFCSYKSLI